MSCPGGGVSGPEREQFGFATTTDVDRIDGDEEIDLVAVCLPTSVHADYVVPALAAGKDVLCELPLASTAVDADLIVDAQRKPSDGLEPSTPSLPWRCSTS